MDRSDFNLLAAVFADHFFIFLLHLLENVLHTLKPLQDHVGFGPAMVADQTFVRFDDHIPISFLMPHARRAPSKHEIVFLISSPLQRLCRNIKKAAFGKGERRSGGKGLDLPARSRFGEGRAVTFSRSNSGVPSI
jgi:hypothetical protein